MNVKENRYLRSTVGAMLTLLAFTAAASTSVAPGDVALEPDSRHENIGELVTTFIQKSHYNHVTVNDELSSAVMDTFIEDLDRNRAFLLASDIEFFEKYRFELDDLVRNEPLDPVFDMYSIYRTRARERFEFALALLEEEPDLSIDEEYQFDRTNEPWASTSEELDELWRKRVKYDVLNLALNDKPWEESQEVLQKTLQTRAQDDCAARQRRRI